MTTTILITNSLRQRAGRAKAKHPCSARIRHGRYNVDVAFREWADHYNFSEADGKWVGSFSDVSISAHCDVEGVQSADGYRFRLVDVCKAELATK